ncbi:MAG: hypothetical protein C4292_04890 [Nitrososphaera sp.]
MAKVRFKPVLIEGAVGVNFPWYSMPGGAFEYEIEGLGHKDGLHPHILVTPDMLDKVFVVVEIPDIYLNAKRTDIDWRKVNKEFGGDRVREILTPDRVRFVKLL